MAGYIDRIREKAVETWIKYIRLDGITQRLTPEEFYAEMQSERNWVLEIIKSGIVSNFTTADSLEGGLKNYFIINDLGEGVVCEKCRSTGAVILLMDENYLDNLENKVFRPSFETYYIKRIQPESDEFVRMFPVPVNAESDYWYCPRCNQLHRLGYTENKKVIYDQKAIPVNINVKEYQEKKEKEIKALFKDPFETWLKNL